MTGFRSAALVACVCLLFPPEPLRAQTPVWEVEEASVTFVIRNAGLPVDGRFESAELDVRFDPGDPEGSSLSGSVHPSSIRTGIAFRDRHLQGREFFHVARYGAVELRSSRIERVGDGRYRGRFRLKIRDVERDVTIPFTYETRGTEATIAGELTLDRLDYGVGEPSIILSDEVRVSVSARLRRTG